MHDILTADRVEAIARDSMPDVHAEPEALAMVKDGKAVIVEGIAHSFCFDLTKLTEHRDELKGMLLELDASYWESGHGGNYFQNMCFDKHGHQWTGLHLTMEQLCCLSIGAGLAQWLLPKSMWPMMGGMPIFTVMDKTWDIDPKDHVEPENETDLHQHMVDQHGMPEDLVLPMDHETLRGMHDLKHNRHPSLG